MINSAFRNKDGLNTWLVDLAGNVAISDIGLALLGRINRLTVPVFVSTEEATVWGSNLDPEQRETLIDIQRTSSNAAQTECNLQRMVNLATQSQLMREAAEAVPESSPARRRSPFTRALPPNETGSRN
jgi:hypothetical protein